MTIYRSLQHFRPRHLPNAVKPVVTDGRSSDAMWYNLHGQPIITPKQGIYIRNGRKVVVR